MEKQSCRSFNGMKCLVMSLLGGLTSTGYTQEVPTGPSTTHDPSVLSQIYVIGARDDIYTIPGSAYYIDNDDIRAMSYDDINRVLQRVPGVYGRQEDGYGLFPNISLRGVDTSRSAKVTLMEDGILAAPAPYAAPAAYYSPTTARMDGLELLKGSSQVKYGPHITGGVINYISTPIPDEQRIYLRSQYGEDSDLRIHGIYGDSIDTAAGRVGYVLEGYIRNTEGFKQIDAAPDFNGSGETGFYNIEPMVKLSWEPGSTVYQRIEFKYGYTDKAADETYLGLGTADFREDPYRRYSSSQFDNIETEHHRTHLRYFISPSDTLDVVTTAYYNEFARNWYKLNDIRATAGGLGSNLDMAAALAGAAAGAGLDCLRGELACGLRVRANNRRYYSRGLQTDIEWRLQTGNVSHELGFGARYHNDVEDRFQWDDVYAQNAFGAITGVDPGVPGTQDNREAETGALAIYIQDTIKTGNWVVQPGFRYETLDLENRDLRPGGTTRDEKLDMASGGIGVAYQLNDAWQALGGVHLGFSPPGPGGAVSGLEEETSTGYELGLRYSENGKIAMAEIVGFYTRFDDLLVVSNIGGTGTGVDENFGKVDSYGVELTGSFDLAHVNNWSFSNQYFVTFTYTSAEQQNDAQSTDPESIFSFGAKGNKVPYIPEYQFTLGTTLNFSRWGGSLTATFVDETFTSANNVDVELNGAGAPDARFGKTDSYEIVDLSVYIKPGENIKLFAGVHNLFDEEYIVSRQPHGPRPGLPQNWFAGIEMDF